MFIRLFFNDLRLLFISFSDYNYLFYYYFNLSSFKNSSFFFFKRSTGSTGYVDFNKRFSSNQITSDFMHYAVNLEKPKYIFNVWVKNNIDMCYVITHKIQNFFYRLGGKNYLNPFTGKDVSGYYNMITLYRLHNKNPDRSGSWDGFVKREVFDRVCGKLHLTNHGSNIRQDVFSPFLLTNLYNLELSLLTFSI